MGNYDDKIRERGLDLSHVLTASFLSGFGEVGALNQAVVNNMMRKLADRAVAWFRVHERGPDLTAEDGMVERVRKVFSLLNEHLQLVGDFRVEADGDGGDVLVSVGSGTCRICPIGVGEAAIHGTACPFPALLQHLVNLYAPDGKKIRIKVADRSMLVKDGVRCWFRFEEVS